MSNEQPQWPLPQEQMLVEIEWSFLPDDVKESLMDAAADLAHNTDYIHVQVTFTNVQELCRPKLHAIVPKFED